MSTNAPTDLELSNAAYSFREAVAQQARARTAEKVAREQMQIARTQFQYAEDSLAFAERELMRTRENLIALTARLRP